MDDAAAQDDDGEAFLGVLTGLFGDLQAMKDADDEDQ